MLLGHVVSGICRDIQQIFVQSSDITVNGDIIIIKDDEHIRLARSGIVQSLQSQASGQGTIAYQCNSLMLKSLQLCRLCKTECSGNGGRRMPRTERIIFTFRTLRESADTVLHPVLPE